MARLGILVCILALSQHVQTARLPKALWPFTDKYDNPGQDISGNGHNADLHNVEKSFLTFPDSKTHAYRFKGSRDSYIEIPNNGLNPSDFTVVMWMMTEVSVWAPLFTWDPQGVYGTHFWLAGNQLFFRPVGTAGQLYTARYQPTITVRQWIRVMASYDMDSGMLHMCAGTNCRKQTTNAAGKPHRTDTVIRLGAHLGIHDNRVFKGEMACVALYDTYFGDVQDIDYNGLKQKCFDMYDYCKLAKEEGSTGTDPASQRFYFDWASRECKEFQYNGNNGNANNFVSRSECMSECSGLNEVQPSALFPLTNKYDNPLTDLSGNGQNATAYNIKPFGFPYPGTDTRGYLFSGSKDSYVQILNDKEMSPKDFTMVVYLYRETDQLGQIFAWDPTGVYATHIWAWSAQRVYFVPVGTDGRNIGSTLKAGLTTRKWVRLVVSYHPGAGVVKICTDDDCSQTYLTGAEDHKTVGPINLGVHRGINDARYYKGEMACLTYYDQFFQDVDMIPFQILEKKCFNNIQFCNLSADTGFGDASQRRFYMNADQKGCEEFTFKGKGGNRNNFETKAQCEKACPSFLPQKPQALWPLSDKYDNPVQDLTGNGHDGKLHSMSAGFFTFPGSETHAYRFHGSKDSYVEIPNQDLTPNDFTLVMWIKPEVSNWGQLWAWDPNGVYGTQLWLAVNQIYFRPMGLSGESFTARYQPTVTVREWVRVVASFNTATGIIHMCANDNCRKQTTNAAGRQHKTDAVIRLGVHLGINDNRVYKGEMTCVAFYNTYVDDVEEIDFDYLKGQCFDMNDFCKLAKNEGSSGTEPALQRFYFDWETRDCKLFTFNGNNGNANNFASNSECLDKCSALIPPKPSALFPLTDKYDDPVSDLSGNSHNATAYNIKPFGFPYPGTDTRGYLFSGSKDSYVQILNDKEMSPKDFTVVVYLYRETDQLGQIFAWDPTGVYATHIWAWSAQRVYFVPVGTDGRNIGSTLKAGLTTRKWVRLVVSYHPGAGVVKICTDEDCSQTYLTGAEDHKTVGPINLGVHRGINDARYYKGEMACLTYYDQFFQDVDMIPFQILEKKCFNNIQFCNLSADSGFGDASQRRFYMNADQKGCEEFTFKGKGGNRNNFETKAQCEKACSSFLPRKPQALWPLSDKYDNPVQDLTGNGHDGKLQNMGPGFFTFPGSETHAYRFRGIKDSYVEIPNQDLTPNDFTLVMWIKPEVSNWGQLWAWDPNGVYGTHLWLAVNQIYFRPMGLSGESFTARYQPTVTVREWVRVVASFNTATGIIHMCANDNCRKQTTNAAGRQHKTDAVIRLGVHLGINDNRVYKGEMTCVAFYNTYVDDVEEIDFDYLKGQCFDMNDFCKLAKNEGSSGTEPASERVYFDWETRDCKLFRFNGNNGNANNFASNSECLDKCSALIPPQPNALFPLTDKYENHVTDLSGNGHSATANGIAPYGFTYPGTATRGCRFSGQKESFVEILNEKDMSPKDFTVVVYLYRETDQIGQIFAWDPTGVYATHIWAWSAQRVYFVPVGTDGRNIGSTLKAGLTTRKWVRLVVSYHPGAGVVKICTDDDCSQNYLTGVEDHKTVGPINLGVHRGINDGRYYRGEMACLTYYDQFFEDVDMIPFSKLEGKCFDQNGFCKLPKDSGTGSELLTRYYLDQESKSCEEFVFRGSGGNKNNFPTKVDCEKLCYAFVAPTPKAIWPLTDKYSSPAADVTGNKPDATMYNLAAGFETFPGTGTYAYRFSGTKESYLEIPNDDMTPTDFTVIMWVKTEVSNWAQLWAWDPNGVWGTHLWLAGTNLYFRPMGAAGAGFPAKYQQGMVLNKWIRVFASYSMQTGKVHFCADEACNKVALNTARQYHNTEGPIRIGVHKGTTDNRFFKGEIACVTYYENYFDDIDEINFSALKNKCFDYNAFCELDADAGSGDDPTFRYRLNKETGECVEFAFNGNGGNDNNFETKNECERICHNYLRAQPEAVWPLTDRYANPVRDITGNGHDGRALGLELGGQYPDTGSQVWAFTGKAGSYVEIPNNGLDVQDFTYVAYVKNKVNAWGPLFLWDETNKIGSNIMSAPSYRLFYRPVSPSGTQFNGAYQNGLIPNRFIRVFVSYSAQRGTVTMCTENKCSTQNLGTAGKAHETSGVIHMGAKLGYGAPTYFNGEIACVMFFKQFIPSMSKINHEYYEKKCFGLKRVATCTCSGDPHCLQYDKRMVHYQGFCSYIMSRDNCQSGMPAGPPTFELIANNRRLGHYPVSAVREATLLLHKFDLEIKMFPQRRVLVNGEVVLGTPYRVNNDVIISITPTNVHITVKDSIKVSFDGIHILSVSISSDMIGKTCGLCGVANDDSSDDWVVGPSELCMKNFPNAKRGEITTNLNLFGNSWTAVIDSDPACKQFCPAPPPPPGCTADTEIQAKEHCSILKDLNGPFGDCLKKMAVTRRSQDFDNCVFDVCALQVSGTIVCTFGSTLSKTCIEDYNVQTVWRSETFCPLDCPSGMMYKPCGNPCMPTCTDIKAENCDEDDGCEEGCYCKPNMVYDGKQCVPKSACGCLFKEKNVVIEVGVSFVKQNCDARCSCDAAGSNLTCTPMSCRENEVCSVQYGKQGCNCEEPFMVLDGECRGNDYICKLPKLVGTGDSTQKRFFFNRAKCSCIQFGYKGEGGNANNFRTKEECEDACVDVPDDCGLPKDVGSTCEGPKPPKKVKKFYFDAKGRKCKKMKYLGCGGNANLFDKKSLCKKKCLNC